MSGKNEKRYWEIDMARGIAVIMMILSNFVFDISFFSKYEVDIQSGFWFYFARLTASLFILIAGISLSIGIWRRGKKHHIKRGIKIFGWGLAITAVTYAVFPAYFIAFGILHLIGFSVIVFSFIVKRKYLCLFLGIFFVLAGLYIQGISAGFPWLVWLGAWKDFSSFDYVPVLPWSGIFLIGSFIGNEFYPCAKRRFLIRARKGRISGFLCTLGRNSLLIYLLHQPLIVPLIFLFA